MNNKILKRKIITISIALLFFSNANNAIATEIFDSINKTTITSNVKSAEKANNSTTKKCIKNGRVIKCTGSGTITRDNSGGTLGDINITPIVISTTPAPVVGTTTINNPPPKPPTPGVSPGIVKPPATSNPPPNTGSTPILLGNTPEIGTLAWMANSSMMNRTPFIGGVTGDGYYRYWSAKSVSPSYCSRETPAISAYWIRSVDYKTRFGENSGGVDRIALFPNEIASYEFIVSSTAVGGGFGVNESTYSRNVGFNVSISKSPCDFNPTDGLWEGNNVCADNSGGVSSIMYETVAPGTSVIPVASKLPNGNLDRVPSCRLEKGKTYYINIRIPPATGTNPLIDRCEEARRSFASGAMGAENIGLGTTLTCGGVIQFIGG